MDPPEPTFPAHSGRGDVPLYTAGQASEVTSLPVRSSKAKYKPHRRNDRFTSKKQILCRQQVSGVGSMPLATALRTTHRAVRDWRSNPPSAFTKATPKQNFASVSAFTKATPKQRPPKGYPPPSTSAASPSPKPIVVGVLIENVDFCVRRLNKGCRSCDVVCYSLFANANSLRCWHLEFKLGKEVEAGNIAQCRDTRGPQLAQNTKYG